MRPESRHPELQQSGINVNMRHGREVNVSIDQNGTLAIDYGSASYAVSPEGAFSGPTRPRNPAALAADVRELMRNPEFVAYANQMGFDEHKRIKMLEGLPQAPLPKVPAAGMR